MVVRPQPSRLTSDCRHANLLGSDTLCCRRLLTPSIMGNEASVPAFVARPGFQVAFGDLEASFWAEPHPGLTSTRQH